MPRRVKDFIEISDYTSLEKLIQYLQTIRESLPANHEAELKIRGDDVFGRRLTITYFRDLTPEEAELESKYGEGEPPADGSIEDLQRRLEQVPYGRSAEAKRAKPNGARR